MKRLCVIFVLCALIGCETHNPNGIDLPVSGANATPDATYEVYMSPIGNDGNPGTMNSPLHTFRGVQELLNSTRPQCDVVVKIRSDQGTYYSDKVIWTYFNSEFKITFESYPDSLYSCFDGMGADTVLFIANAPISDRSNLHFKNLSIRHYIRGAIRIMGAAHTTYLFNSHNSIRNCIFQDIGNEKHPDKMLCWGVIQFDNCRNSVIENCVFLNCANANTQVYPQAISETSDLPENLPIIGVYVAHYSLQDTIVGCTFRNFKGDCVRIRDSSNYNEICYNTAIKAGWTAFCTMWYCHSLFTPNCTEDECPSWFNRIHHNTLLGDWLCGYPKLFEDMRPQFNFEGNCTYYPNGVRVIMFDNKLEECSPNYDNTKDEGTAPYRQ